MKTADQIPYYAPDGTSLGFRTIDAATRLIAHGAVKPSYGRKGHLKAIWLLQADGGNPVESHVRTGTRYSFRQRLDTGHHSWKHKRLDSTDDGVRLNYRRAFFQVITE